MTWTTQQIAHITGGRLVGDGSVSIASMQTVELAGPDQLTFIGHSKYAKQWPACLAAAALVAEGIDLEPGDGRPFIRVRDVDLAAATLLDLMAPPPPEAPPGVHPAAVVHPSARLGGQVSIGPQCTVGPHAVIGDRTVLHPHVTVMDHAVIGADCTLWPGVVIRERCSLGDLCILHPNVTIGADGFGYRPSPAGNGLVKIPQIGTVKIGSGVEIGAGVCVDRAKFGATEIGDGTKIDNLVQIAHNCRIGRRVVIAGCTGIAGSSVVGDGAVIGGCAVVSDHVTIGPGATLAGGAFLMRDLPAGEVWAGYPAKPAKISVKEWAALARLPEHLKEARR